MEFWDLIAKSDSQKSATPASSAGTSGFMHDVQQGRRKVEDHLQGQFNDSILATALMVHSNSDALAVERVLADEAKRNVNATDSMRGGDACGLPLVLDATLKLNVHNPDSKYRTSLLRDEIVAQQALATAEFEMGYWQNGLTLITGGRSKPEGLIAKLDTLEKLDKNNSQLPLLEVIEHRMEHEAVEADRTGKQIERDVHS
jgi:hypothetical protein